MLITLRDSRAYLTQDENQRIDAVIRDEHARIFWKRYFAHRDSAAWEEFARALTDFLGADMNGALSTFVFLDFDCVVC